MLAADASSHPSLGHCEPFPVVHFLDLAPDLYLFKTHCAPLSPVVVGLLHLLVVHAPVQRRKTLCRVQFFSARVRETVRL